VKANFWSTEFRKGLVMPLCLAVLLGTWSFARDINDNLYEVRNLTKEMSKIEARLSVLESKVVDQHEVNTSQSEAIHKLQSDIERGR
jgi:uncharacterized coiled-coil protein SlyX